mmetsp:Transcript_49410/g.98436  ORF Transcript_49410/g.98436 Transcript_49410/m.98436 type:complete len:257 (-) Transcript_49410:373-1143(-)
MTLLHLAEAEDLDAQEFTTLRFYRAHSHPMFRHRPSISVRDVRIVLRSLPHGVADETEQDGFSTRECAALRQLDHAIRHRRPRDPVSHLPVSLVASEELPHELGHVPRVCQAARMVDGLPPRTVSILTKVVVMTEEITEERLILDLSYHCGRHHPVGHRCPLDGRRWLDCQQLWLQIRCVTPRLALMIHDLGAAPHRKDEGRIQLGPKEGHGLAVVMGIDQQPMYRSSGRQLGAPHREGMSMARWSKGYGAVVKQG